MKKLLLLIPLMVLMFGCSKDKNITFTAVIDSVTNNEIIIETSDDVGFEKAVIHFNEDYQPDFDIREDQIVEITILPEIRESNPVQVTAINISLAEDVTDSVEYKKITADEAAEMMNGNVVILDTRTKDEYDEGHIKNAVLLPYDEISAKADEALPDKYKTILVYCRTGRRSEIAAKELISLGYSSVYDFGGITTDWTGEVVK